MVVRFVRTPSAVQYTPRQCICRRRRQGAFADPLI